MPTPPPAAVEGARRDGTLTCIDIAREHTITLSQVPEHLPPTGGGGKVHVKSVYRWVQRGLRGIRLECLQVGGRRCTSVEALQRFFDRLTASSGAGAVVQRQTGSTQARRAQQDRAARALRELLGGNATHRAGRRS